MSLSMHKKWLLTASILFATAYADNALNVPPPTHPSVEEEPLVPPEVIEAEIVDAQKEFDEAKKMFNPWYTGPLLTPSAHVAPYHTLSVQPYIYYINNYAKFNKHGHSHHIPNFEVVQIALAPAQVGITHWMDIAVVAQGLWQHQKGEGYMNWGDTSVSIGFGLVKETPYNPAFKIVFKEVFPTGKYQNFSTHKAAVEGTGAGSYQTTFSANVSKVVWWLTEHPMGLRLSLNYTLPSHVHVNGFNSYGGGPGTHGTVKPGSSIAVDFGYEYSFTQRWVAALDIAYTYNWKTRFSGTTTATVGGPFNDQLSLAPALEYNPTPNLGFLTGLWFSVWGRNSFNFLSEIISVTYTF
ncbi:MAG: hypothetical protein JSR76_07975 [Verrucomicrobia bacterium]|nr:hypothetical protein [Verrucomicrobiota bacterium]